MAVACIQHYAAAMDRRSFIGIGVGAVTGAVTAGMPPSFSEVSTPDRADEPRDHIIIDRKQGPMGTIVRPTTIEFVGDGEIVVPADASWGIHVVSSDVTITNPRITGPGSVWPAQSAARTGIWIEGTAGADPLRGIGIIGGKIEHFGYAGVRAEYVNVLTVTRLTVRDIAYAGVLMRSVRNGRVEDCDIADLIHDPYPNSYGIVASRDTNKPIELAPRCRDITITGNTVSNVPRWEGIDTHGGERITISHNTVTDCATGIALVPLKAAGGGPVDAAPLDCDVTDNTIRWTRGAPDLPSPMRAGINMVGAGTSVGQDAERATGTIAHNTISGYGIADKASRAGAVLVYFTEGLVIDDNTIESGTARGIVIYHTNEDTVVSNNTINALTNGSAAYCSAIEVLDRRNDVTVVGNTAFSDGSIPDGTRNGIFAPIKGNTIRIGTNDWGANTTEVSPTNQTGNNVIRP